MLAVGIRFLSIYLAIFEVGTQYFSNHVSSLLKLSNYGSLALTARE